MSPEEVSFLDLLDRTLAERDRTMDARLRSIAETLGETREDIRGMRAQLGGAATAAEIASHKRQVAAELAERDRQHGALAGRVDVVEDHLGERVALERQRNRAWAAAAALATIAIALASVVVAVL